MTIEYKSDKWWAFSILSDAQELIGMGFKQEAIEKINDAKRVLAGMYKEVEYGLCIEIQQPVKIEQPNSKNK